MPRPIFRRGKGAPEGCVERGDEAGGAVMCVCCLIGGCGGNKGGGDKRRRRRRRCGNGSRRATGEHSLMGIVLSVCGMRWGPQHGHRVPSCL